MGRLLSAVLFSPLECLIVPLFLAVLWSGLLVGCAKDIRLTRTPINLPLSPEEVVTLFQDSYGTPQMDRIGPYTTGRFRDGLPIAVWIIDTWDQLQELGYEKLEFETTESWVHKGGDYATVVILTKILTRAGATEQQEVFILMLDEGIWKIDELYVTDEEISSEDQRL
jgi:hypothetical protein